MTQEYKIPWASWYEPDEMNLEFPDSWEIDLIHYKNLPEITKKEEIGNKINSPINTKPLSGLANDAKNVVIVVDDISRHTKLESILLVTLEELNDAGINDNEITIISALGGHRPMTRFDFIKKIGLSVLERVNVENHHPFYNLVHSGKSKLETPIYLNKTYAKADLRITVGGVIPHGLAGFGGGAKMVLPGVCGIKTLEANHRASDKGIGIGIGHITQLREDIEDVCSRVGLDFSINIVPSISGNPIGIFAGHFIDAHRDAIKLFKETYEFTLPQGKKYDVGFFNAYPEDTELSQSIKALNAYFLRPKMISFRGGVVMLSASTEGRGFHSLSGQTGAPLYNKDRADHIIWKIFGKRKLFFHSPNVTKADVKHFYPSTMKFHENFQILISELESSFGTDLKVCVIPSSIQLPKRK